MWGGGGEERGRNQVHMYEERERDERGLRERDEREG